MVPHRDVGRRIYGKSRMLLLNLRRGAVLPLSVTASLLVSLLLSLPVVLYLLLSDCRCPSPPFPHPFLLSILLLILYLCPLCSFLHSFFLASLLPHAAAVTLYSRAVSQCTYREKKIPATLKKHLCGNYNIDF